MPAQKYVALNLQSKDAFSESFLGKILMWALSIGRYIVVFTELIVILSFLSRFKLDRDLTDLNARINQQLLVIESYGDLEVQFRDLQSKLSFMRTKLEDADVEKSLDIVIRSMPPDVRLKNVTSNKDRLSLSAVSLSSRGFYQFVTGLKREQSFADLKLSNVSSDDELETGIEFDLTIDLKQGGN